MTHAEGKVFTPPTSLPLGWQNTEYIYASDYEANRLCCRIETCGVTTGENALLLSIQRTRRSTSCLKWEIANRARRKILRRFVGPLLCVQYMDGAEAAIVRLALSGREIAKVSLESAGECLCSSLNEVLARTKDLQAFSVDPLTPWQWHEEGHCHSVQTWQKGFKPVLRVEEWLDFVDQSVKASPNWTSGQERTGLSSLAADSAAGSDTIDQRSF